MSTKNPTLKKIGGVFCYRLAFGTRFAEGDRWDNNVLTDLFDLRVDTTTELLGGMWRPVVVPAGYRIRDLDEKAQPGDLSGVITKGIVKVDPMNDGPLPVGSSETRKTVREIINSPLLALNEPGSGFQGDDFVVLAPLLKTSACNASTDRDPGLTFAKLIATHALLTSKSYEFPLAGLLREPVKPTPFPLTKPVTYQGRETKTIKGVLCYRLPVGTIIQTDDRFDNDTRVSISRGSPVSSNQENSPSIGGIWRPVPPPVPAKSEEVLKLEAELEQLRKNYAGLAKERDEFRDRNTTQAQTISGYAIDNADLKESVAALKGQVESMKKQASGNAVLVQRSGWQKPLQVPLGARQVYSTGFYSRSHEIDAFGRRIYREV